MRLTKRLLGSEVFDGLDRNQRSCERSSRSGEVLIPWFAIVSDAGTMPDWCQAEPPGAARALARACGGAGFGRDTPIWRARQIPIEIRLVQLDAQAWIDGAPDLA